MMKITITATSYVKKKNKKRWRRSRLWAAMSWAVQYCTSVSSFYLHNKYINSSSESSNHADTNQSVMQTQISPTFSCHCQRSRSITWRLTQSTPVGTWIIWKKSQMKPSCLTVHLCGIDKYPKFRASERINNTTHVVSCLQWHCEKSPAF